MAERTGYNLSKIQEEMDKIKSNYDNLGKNITTEWGNVVRTMQANWVGEDEQNYEATLAKKINTLYEFAAELANHGIQTLFNLGQKWHDSQKSNLLENSVIISSAVFNLQLNKAVYSGDIISPIQKEISATEDRGLVFESSKDTIKGKLEAFKKTIDSQVKGLIDLSTLDSAFFGSQVSSIKTFVERVNNAMGEVLSAFNDLYTALDTLAGSQYDVMSGYATDEITESSSSLESAVESTGGRWQ